MLQYGVQVKGAQLHWSISGCLGKGVKNIGTRSVQLGMNHKHP